MKKSLLASVLLPLLAAASDSCSAPAPEYFMPVSERGGSNIQFQPFEANSGFFYLLDSSTTYCPSTVDPNCPTPGQQPAFSVSGGECSLYVIVPGGQQVYVAPDGALSYTQAHSAAIPAGSITTGFSYDSSTSPGSFYAPGAWVACPTHKGAYQIFVTGKGLNVNTTNCLGFDAGTSKYTGNAPAWEYTT